MSCEIRVKDLSLDVPEFVHQNITVKEVFELADSNPTNYFKRIDDLFCVMIYPLHSKDLWPYLNRSPGDLIDPDFKQMSFNFVMSATIGWSAIAKKEIIDLNGFGEPKRNNVVNLVIH